MTGRCRRRRLPPVPVGCPTDPKRTISPPASLTDALTCFNMPFH